MTSIKLRLSAFSFIAAAWLLGLGPARAQNPVPQQLPTAALSAGMHRIVAQVAQSAEERATGLMHRRQMPVHEGMLFIFDQPDRQCFWMKNTWLPLSAAFLDDTGTIVNVVDMQPQTETPHCSAAPVRFVLEMNQGWFAQRGLKAGSRVSGPMFRP